jgi:hypothetical protein
VAGSYEQGNEPSSSTDAWDFLTVFTRTMGFSKRPLLQEITWLAS